MEEDVVAEGGSLLLRRCETGMATDLELGKGGQTMMIKSTE
jgi:hypothetical protein